MLPRLIRAARIGVVAGVSVFVVAWIALGSRLDDYSPASEMISQIARIDRSTHLAMTVAFATFGVTMCAFALALRSSNSRSWTAALVHGVSVIGVALTPLGTTQGDHFHNVCAGVAYVSLATLPWLFVRRDVTTNLWRLARGTSIAIGTSLVLSVFGPASTAGLFQRLGLTIGDAWIIYMATLLFVQQRSSTAGGGYSRSHD
jgi:hypothetical protein